ncbi:MAG TPA: VWA domain-containing protein [Blastocatellia bacterium]|nr:VWA domain-containing protein [Blastocatellia bacterium]
MTIEFTNPMALLLLALIPLAIYLARHSLANLPRRRAVFSTSVRAALLVLVVLALAGPRLRTASRDLALIFLVDVSASVNQQDQPAAIDLINREIEHASARDYVGVIAFAREPAVEVAPTRKEVLGEWRLKEISSNPPRDYTDIAAALRLARALVPDDAVGRIVLISDGNENLDNAMKHARPLRADGIEVYTRALSTISDRAESVGETAIRELSVPEKPALGEAFDLKVTIDSTRDTDALLRVYRNDTVAAERTVRLIASGENVFLLPQRIEEKGFFTYRAEVEALRSDGFVQNNSREAFAVVEGRPKTLYVHGDPRPSPAVLRVLIEGSFAAQVITPGALPSTLAGFQDYDLVIFDNVPALALTKDQMRMVQAYVKELGGGFVMIGGDQSFGPGGYYKTPIEETLPVSLDVRKKKHFPSLAIVLVIDKSGSMMGQKVQLAVEAASATVDFLSERDSVGVIAFDSTAQPVVNLTPVEDKDAIIRQIRSIQAVGGTNMYPGLRTAYEWLLASDAQIKHIIVLSDGQSEGGDFAGIARSIREQGMTMTAVAVGEDADFQTMRFIANRGGGRFYATDHPDNLPRIFTREAFLASRSTIIEEPFVPRLVRATQATGGIDWTAAPQLGGYVGTAERDSLQSPAIMSLVSDKDDPVYAVWQYGLGRAAAFTSDAKPRWAAGWMNWPGFGQFWAQVLRDTLRREGAMDLTPRVEINAGRGHITVDATTPEGGSRNNLRLSAHVVAPDLSPSNVQLEQTAAGRYEGEFAAPTRGAYLVSVSEEVGRPASVTGSVSSYSPEFNITGEDSTLLAQLSEETGGRVISTSGSDAASGAGSEGAVEPGGGASNEVGLFERRGTRTLPREIWQVLMLVALLLLPIDVGVRRVHVTREQMIEARRWVARRFGRRRAAEVEVEPVAVHAQLKGARARVRLGEGEAELVEHDRREDVLAEAEARPAGKLEEARAASLGPPVESDEAQPLASRLLWAKRKRRD